MAGNWFYAIPPGGGQPLLFSGSPSSLPAGFIYAGPAPDPSTTAQTYTAAVPTGGTPGPVPVSNTSITGLQYDSTKGQYVDAQGNPVPASVVAAAPPPDPLAAAYATPTPAMFGTAPNGGPLQRFYWSVTAGQDGVDSINSAGNRQSFSSYVDMRSYANANGEQTVSVTSYQAAFALLSSAVQQQISGAGQAPATNTASPDGSSAAVPPNSSMPLANGQQQVNGAPTVITPFGTIPGAGAAQNGPTAVPPAVPATTALSVGLTATGTLAGDFRNLFNSGWGHLLAILIALWVLSHLIHAGS